MPEVKTLISEMNTVQQFYQQTGQKQRGKKIHELEARLIEINQTIRRRIKANM